MATITHGRVELYTVMSGDIAGKVVVLTMKQAFDAVFDGEKLGLNVDAWSDPWPVSIEENGRLHARCPTASEGVRPQIVPGVTAPSLERCMHCGDGVLDARLGGMCGDCSWCKCPDPGLHRGCSCRAAQGFRYTSDDWCNCACHPKEEAPANG